MMYSGDEEFGDEITSGIFPDDNDDGFDVEAKNEERVRREDRE